MCTLPNLGPAVQKQIVRQARHRGFDGAAMLRRLAVLAVAAGSSRRSYTPAPWSTPTAFPRSFCSIWRRPLGRTTASPDCAHPRPGRSPGIGCSRRFCAMAWSAARRSTRRSTFIVWYRRRCVSGCRRRCSTSWCAGEQGQAAEAEQCLRRALAGREATLPPQHPELAGPLNNLGWLLNSQSRVAESEVFLRRALSIRETNFRPGPPALAASQNNLGWCLMRQGRNAEAEPLFRAALAVWEATYGPEHPYLVFGLHNLAAVLAATGRAEQANQLRERAQALSQLRSAPLVREQS